MHLLSTSLLPCSGVSAAPVPGGIDAADDSSMVFRFAIAMRCFASLAAFCFSSNSAFVFAMIASNSFLRFFASVAFCGVEVLAAAGVVVVVAVVVAGVDASGVFVVVAAAAAAEPKAVVGVPNGADGFPNGAATDLLPPQTQALKSWRRQNPWMVLNQKYRPWLGLKSKLVMFHQSV